MKEEDEIKRLRNLLLVASLFALLLMVIIVAWASWELSGVRKESMLIQAKIDAVELTPGANGIDGKDGQAVDGQDGRDGKDGRDGVDSISTTVIQQVPIKGDTGEQGVQGEKGETGASGADGKTVFTRYNLFTGEYECRYAGDNTWQPESECQ